MGEKKIAVLGCGLWGRNIVRNFYNLNALGMVCDLDDENLAKVKEQYPNVKTTKDFHDILNSVNLKKIANSLHNASKSFKAHSCINIGVLHRSIVSVSVRIVLRENEVPEFNISVTIATNSTVRLAATIFLASVKIYF